MRKYTAFSYREPVPSCQSNLALRELSLFSSWGSQREPMQMAVPTSDDENTSSRNLLCVQFPVSALTSAAVGTAQGWLRDPGIGREQDAECAWAVPTPSVCGALASPRGGLWVPQQISSSAAPWAGTDPTSL